MARNAVEIKDLNYAYPDGTRALSHLDLHVFEGEAVGLIGPNGAGKSTLLLHLNGILRTGHPIRIFGQDITDNNLPMIRSRVGLVFQDPEHQLFMPTVFDDVGFGPVNMGMKKDDVVRSVQSALEEVDMLSFAERSSHHLSVGEKKRVAIATVLSMHPQILVLDEPSSNLDPKHRRELINLLKKLTLTKIIATHDLDLVSEICTRVAILDKGRIVAVGPASAILQDNPLLARHDLDYGA
jgi:cobalt/nickel transport system ATP-binding protein